MQQQHKHAKKQQQPAPKASLVDASGFKAYWVCWTTHHGRVSRWLPPCVCQRFQGPENAYAPPKLPAYAATSIFPLFFTANALIAQKPLALQTTPKLTRLDGPNCRLDDFCTWNRQ